MSVAPYEGDQSGPWAYPRRMSRSPLSLVLALSLAAGALAVGSAPAQAATRSTQVSVALSRVAPIVGETFSASGRTSTRFQRPVVLRMRVDGTWRTVRRVTASSTGRYRVTGLRTTAARSYSVVAPAVRHSGTRWAAATSRVVRATPVHQRAALDVLPQVAQRGTSVASSAAAGNSLAARFSPARAGRRVTFARRNADGTWRVLSTTRQRSDGTAYLIGTASRIPTSGTYRAVAGAASGAAAVASAATRTPWVRTFRDEFSGSALDLRKWSYRVGTSASRTHAVNSARAVAVGGGRLQMSVKRKPGSSKLLNAQISTQPRSATQGHLQRYGVFSARIRYPEHRGQHGSFWMQSPTYGRYAGSAARSGAEIDVSEFFGRNYPDGGLGTFVYYANKSHTNVKIGDVWRRAAALAPKGDRWWNAYHVFSLRWTPNRYLFYVDGRLLFTTTRGVSRTQEYLILSLLTSDWELPQLDRSKLPSHMDVDWTTAWQSNAG